MVTRGGVRTYPNNKKVNTKCWETSCQYHVLILGFDFTFTSQITVKIKDLLTIVCPVSIRKKLLHAENKTKYFRLRRFDERELNESLLYFFRNVFGLIVITIDHLKHEGCELSGNLHFHRMGSYLDCFS